MDVLTILSTLLRRWEIVAGVSVLTALALGGIVYRAEPTYQLRGSFLVTQSALGDTVAAEPGGVDGAAQDPEQDDTPAVLNPVLIAEAVQDGDVAEEVRAQGGTSDYQVEVDGDLLRVVASNTDRAKVVPTVTGVLDAIEKEVAAIQADAGVPDERQAVIERVAVPSDASVRGELTSNQGVEYSARGAVRVVGPGVGGYNPYAESPFTVRILEEVLAGEAARARVADTGGTGTYLIEQEDQDTAPIVYLTATGASAREAKATFTAARAVASDELGARQAAIGAPEGARIGLFELSVPDEASELSSGLARPLITVAALGGVAAVGLALLVDNLAQGLRRRRARLRAATKDTEEDAEQDEEDGVVSADDALAAVEEPASEQEPVADSSPESGSDSDSEPDDDERIGAVATNGNGMARQTRESMYLAVLGKVFGDDTTSRPKPPVRELMPGTPTDVR